MTFSLQALLTVTAIGSPVDKDGLVQPKPALLSNSIYTSSDPTVFTVASDPATPNGAIITAVGAGTATLMEEATATETDGLQHQITGIADITVTAVPVNVDHAASLVFAFGVPVSPAPVATN